MKEFKSRFRKLLKIGMLPLAALFLMIILVIFYFFYSSPYKTFIENEAVILHYADNISLAHEKIIKEFNETYEGIIEVKAVNLPFYKFSTNDRKELLTRSLRSKNERLDLFAVDIIWVERFAKWAEPLNNHIGDNLINRFWPHAITTCYDSDSNLVAMPHTTDVSMLYANMELIKEYFTDEHIGWLERGIYWDELLKLKKLTKGNNNPFYTLPLEDFEGLVCNYYGSMLNLSDKIFEDDGSLNNSTAVKAYQIYHDLVHKYDITPKNLTKLPSQETINEYISENGFFFRGWPAHYRTVQVLRGDTQLSNYHVYPLPRFRDTEPVGVFGGWNVMISKYSQHKSEALIFLKYMMSRKAQEHLYDVSFLLPARRDLFYDKAFLKKYPEIQKFIPLIGLGKHRPYSEDYTRISDIVSYYVHRSLNEELSFDEALKQANEMITSQKTLIK